MTDRIEHYIRTANEKVRRHLPDSATVVMPTNSRRALGVAIDTREKFRGKPIFIIQLSRAHLAHDTHEEILNTIRHEIAHLIAGVENGHNSKWRAACKITGAIPSQFAEIEKNRFKWVARCSSCTRTLGGWFRKPTVQRACARCGVTVELVQQY